MKKLLLLIAIIIVFSGCKKSDSEIEIEQLQKENAIYELRKAKLSYLKDLIEIKENINYEERVRLIDSAISSERINFKQD